MLLPNDRPLDLPAATSHLSTLAEYERKRGLSFIIETRGAISLAKVRAQAKALLGPRCRVKALFPGRRRGDAARLAAFFVATVPGMSVHQVGSLVYDFAYQLRERSPDFLSVEPDTPSAAYQARPQDVGFAGSSSSSLDCTQDEQGAPVDRLWSLTNIRVPASWELVPPPGGRGRGEGISVGHLDTGYAAHAELDLAALDVSRGYDFVTNDDDPTDPLESGWLEQPGHGTATGSVIVSRVAGALSGVAPAATLVPIRCTKSVVLIFSGSDVARAIVHAADHDCQVISMSLGGVPRRVLEEAVNYAVSRNAIVVAAAGNCVGFVTAPAIYDNCIAVAGTTALDQAWQGSCYGPAVDVAAPAEFVWCAARAPDNPNETSVRPGQGTSFAVANVAGLAALWLAHHGLQTLRSRYAGESLQHVFARLLARTARRPAGWDGANYGAGIVDALDLLSADLPAADAGAPVAAVRAPAAHGYLGLLENLLGEDAARSELATLFGSAAALDRSEMAARVEPFGAELFDILLTRGAGRPELGLAGAVAPAAGAESGRHAARVRDLVAANASLALRRALAPG